MEKTCLHCGGLFIARSSGVGRKQAFCSRPCRDRNRTKKFARKCERCGIGFNARYSRARFCSSKCWRKTTRTLKDQVRKCAVCEREFTPKAKAQKHCGLACSSAKRGDPERSRTREYALKNKRRAKLRESGQFIERRAIFERDGWMCQLCGEPVTDGLHYTHPMCATLDHIVPIALGGEHVQENVQLAHMRCNSRKGKKWVNAGQLQSHPPSSSFTRAGCQ